MEALTLRFEGDVLAAQQGDRHAFTRLIDASRNAVCAITLAIVRDVTSSEDVAQDVFVAAWTSVKKLRNPSSFLPWLRQLARNHAYEFLRTRTRYGRRHVPAESDASMVADAAADASQLLIDEEERKALAEAIEQLPDDAREIVTLYYREGNSVRQVAELLGLSEETVKKRMERARSALKSKVMESFALTVQRTAPGAGFTAAVVAAISLGAPTTATAAGLGITKTLGSSTAAPLGKLAAVIVGPLIGLASAVSAIVIGNRRLVRLARDAEERRALARFQAANLALVLVTFVAWWIGPRLARGPLPMVIPWIWFSLGIGLSYKVWLPRIVARRLATERLEDPDAERRQRRESIRATIGTAIGIVLSLAGLLYGLLR